MMKKPALATLAAACLLTACTKGACQKIIESRIDEFKGHSVTKTSWEKLFTKGGPANETAVKYSFSKINNTMFIDIKMILLGGGVFSVNQGDDLIFLFEDATTSTYKAVSNVVASQGGGSTGLWGSALWGGTIRYSSKEDPNFTTLSSKNIKKVRIYTNKEYTQKEIKPKVNKVLKNSIKLITKS